MLGLVGCSSSAAEPAAAEDPAELVNLKVGVTPTAVSISQYAALDAGIYEEHGLNVEHHVQTNLAETMPLLLSGDLDYVYADTHNVIAARAEGMPIGIIAPVVVAPSKAPESGRGTLNFIVKEDSDIQGIQDFEGKVLAISALGGQAHLDIQTVLKREGLDVSSVEFIAIPPPQMEAAIRQGQADIVGLVEPLGTAAFENGGLRMVGQTDDAIPNAPMFVLIATEETIAKKAETNKAFADAMYEAAGMVNSDRDFTNEVMAGFMDMPIELIAKTTIPLFATKDLTRADLKPVVDRLITMNVLPEDKRGVIDELVAK